MRPIKNVIFSLLFLVIFAGSSFAAPGIKITKPVNGSLVKPGQKVTVTITSIGGFKPKQGVANITHSPLNVSITRLPLFFTDTIPQQAFGTISVDAIAKDASGNIVVDSITLKVQQTVTLQSLTIYSDELLFQTDWDGNVKSDYDHNAIGCVFGRFSDGVERYLGDDPNTTYVSSDPSLISIDNKGKIDIHKAGNVKITISNSGVSLIVPIAFEGPRGIRPQNTTPPTTRISIKPRSNFAGWYNKDITITITAKANDIDTIQEIVYEFPSYNDESKDVNGDSAVIPFSHEGTNLFRYGAYDNERNSSGQQSLTIQLDKTPPAISIALAPYKGKLQKLSYSAVDSLSGVKELKAGLVVPDISGYKVQLVNGSKGMVLNEATKRLIVTAPNPKQVLDELKAYGFFTIGNNQIVQLNANPKTKLWQVTKSGSTIVIKAPSIAFRARAIDKADNVAVVEKG